MLRRTLLPRRTDTRPKLDRAATPRPRRATDRPALESLESRRLLAVTANPDIYVALEDTPLNVAASGVLANDSTTTGTALAVTASTQPAHGVVALAPDGTFSYTPTANYVGPDAFTYTVADGLGGSATGTVNLAVSATTDVASVFAGPRLASVSSTQGTLLNAVLGGLVGTNLNLSVADYNSLGSGTINGGRLANALGAELGVTPAQALTTNATLAQVITAAATVAQADGDTAQVTALNALAAAVGPLTQPIRLGDLLQVDPNNGSLANAELNTLDLVTGSIQLFNSRNVVATPAPIAVSGASLGLPANVGGVSISPQVVEPPILTTGPTGTQFRSAAVRLRIDLNLVNNLDTSGVTSALTGLLGPLVNVTANASLANLSVYTEVARGQGTIAAIDAIANSVTLQATPGLADVYIGSIANSLFFDRTRAINPATDVGFGNVGTLTIGTTGLITTGGTTQIQLRSVAQGEAPTSSTQVFNAPFPQSQTVSTSATFLTNLVNALATNTQVQLSGSLGGVLDPLVNGTVLPIIRPLVTGVVTPLLTPVLGGVVDPLLRSLGTGLGELDLTVNAIARAAAPAANGDFATTAQGQAIPIAVLANDASIPGEPIRVAGVTAPAHGTAVINPDGTVTYTPAPGYIGGDAFSYTITDPNGLTSTAVVTVNVTPTPPTAAPDTYLATQDTPLVVPGPGVLGNDTSPNATPLAAVVDTNPTNGTLVLNPDGSFTYTPNPGYVGADAFTYRATDGVVFSNPVAVVINVQPALPTANPDAYTATAGQSLVVPAATGVLANDASTGGLPLSAVLGVGPTNGILTLNADGSFAYTPTAGYVGPDSFTYRAVDANGTSTPVAVAITVQAAPPAANPDAYTATAGQVLTVPAATGVLANDVDPNGLPLSAVAASQPLHGTLALNPDGSFTYTPEAGYVGPDSFTYRAVDASGTSGVIAVAITVQAGTPAGQADFYNAISGIPLNIPAVLGVLANDATPNGLPLTATLVTGPTNGTLTLNADGSFTYTPTAGYVGPDSFTYTPADALAAGGPVTVLFAVQAAPDNPGTPAGQADFYDATSGQALTVPAAQGVLANDTTPNNLLLTAAVASQPAHGTLTFNADGSFTYTPTAGYVGQDSFTYTPADALATGAPVAVILNVRAAATPAAPVGLADFYDATSGQALTVPAATGVLANDTDPNNLPLTAAVATGPAHGTLTLNADGSFTYTPTAGYVGADFFTYRPANASATGVPVAVVFNVRAAATNPGTPLGLLDLYVATSGQALTVPASQGVLANDTTPNGLPLTATVVTGPTNGTLTLNPDGSFTYTPTAGYVGQDSFTYRPADALATGAPVPVVFVVQPASAGPRPPVGLLDLYDATSGQPLSVPAAAGVLANDTGSNNLPLTATVASQPAHGTLVLNPDGSFTYTPTAGYVGQDSFTYRPTDAQATGSPVPVVVNVRAAANPNAGVPTAVPDVYVGAANTPLVVPPALGVLANDVDPDGQPLTAVTSTQPQHGTLVLNPDGSFTYTPTAGYVGADSFAYRASDGTNQSAPAFVTLVVNPAGTGTGVTIVTTYPVTGTAGTPITQAPIVSYTDGDGSTPPGSYTAVINWGDGTGTSTGTVTVNNGVYLVSGDHTYAQAGTYPVAVVVTRPGSPGVAASTAATIAPAASGDTDPSTASLAGTIFHDADGDGDQDLGEPGLAGRTIALTGTSNAGVAISRTTTSNADGSYRFTGLPGGTYTLTSIRADGTVRAAAVRLLAPRAQVGTLGGTAAGRVIAGIALPAATAGTGYDFASPEGSTIAGRVYLDANRNGRDDANEFGIATVVMTLTGTTAFGNPVSRTVTTDAQGNYSFIGLAPGTYQVQVSRPTAFFTKGAITVGDAGGVVRGESVGSINIGTDVYAGDYDFAEINRANCRLSTAAVRALLRIGANGTVPASFRPSSLNTNGPLNRYLPTLVALVNNRPGAPAARNQGQRVRAAGQPVKVQAAAVKVQYGMAKPKAAAQRGK